MWTKNITNLSPPPAIADWLSKPQNLSQALRRVCCDLSLTIISQKMESPMKDESIRLGLVKRELQTEERCYIRKIFLKGDGVPLTYGRVVIPDNVYKKYYAAFSQLKNKLLGETLLYNNPRTQRSYFEYADIRPPHPLFESILMALPPTFCVPVQFWGRRSLFYMESIDPLLVVDILLYDLPYFMDDDVLYRDFTAVR